MERQDVIRGKEKKEDRDSVRETQHTVILMNCRSIRRNGSLLRWQQLMLSSVLSP